MALFRLNFAAAAALLLLCLCLGGAAAARVGPAAGHHRMLRGEQGGATVKAHRQNWDDMNSYSVNTAQESIQLAIDNGGGAGDIRGATNRASMAAYYAQSGNGYPAAYNAWWRK
ncbi:hypothetical protein Rsub_09890 [Raphidocelis subcapitata]|uniref:SCP domain-containing protein n=1 Tax=Raphidocelis subcapitata TaxID=307507 RepID=A0A2V0PIK3_9CHLO|nr:hypothetical protein Rsub_09890 [Raphidocelis subcapitata]|eukprot:GBF96885.1 hypothetical protein Rsub_09890 [Raphidocelis subcapitata]